MVHDRRILNFLNLQIHARNSDSCKKTESVFLQILVLNFICVKDNLNFRCFMHYLAKDFQQNASKFCRNLEDFFGPSDLRTKRQSSENESEMETKQDPIYINLKRLLSEKKVAISGNAVKAKLWWKRGIFFTLYVASNT